MSDERQDSEDYARPRRPDLDTISYLKGLPLDVDEAKQEIAAFLEQGGEFPQILAAAFSAIDEIRMEVASLAGDEYGSQGLELLAHLAAPYSELAARILLNACSGYHLHLATHRFGSHVVQTILQLAVSSSCDNDLAMHEESPSFDESTDSVPTLADLIQGMVEELSPHSSELAVHVCGSHVLRTLLCVLGGVDLLSSPSASSGNRVVNGAILRGKKKSKKKKKKKKPEGDDSSMPHAGTMHIIYRTNSRLNVTDFEDSLKALTFALIGNDSKQPGELQQLSGHPSAGPLLIVLLRVLTYSSSAGKAQWEKLQAENNDTMADFRLGISRPEPTFEIGSLAHTMVCRILCWEDGADTQPQAGNIIFGLSGEPRGSHLLESLLRLTPDDMHEAIIKCGDFANPTSMQEYAEHNVSNFVVQTMLTTIRTKEQAESMLKVVEKVISSGLAVDGAKRRRGILWRAVELASKFRVGQDGILKSIRLGFAAINKASIDTSEQDHTEDDEAKKKKKQRKKATSVEVKYCIKSILGLRMPEKDGDRVILDAAGARTIYHMLRFTPRLCEEVLKGCIDEHSAEELLLIAKDGLGSRCIMDGLLDGPIRTPIFAAASKTLYSKLKDNWVSLSTDRVGHHTVKKLFTALPRIDDKAKLMEELVSGGNRLIGNTMGRTVVEACSVDEYRENPKQWRKQIAKMIDMKEDSFLEEVTKPTGGESGEKQKPKRKRSRKKKGAEGDETEQPPNKKSNVDSIMEAMTAS
jgi:nucleolar protein 9